MDDVFFIQTKETPTNSSSTNNGSNNSITSSTSSSNKDTSIPTITEQTSTTPAGMANSTKPISALDKATFPFPCYLEMVSFFLSKKKKSASLPNKIIITLSCKWENHFSCIPIYRLVQRSLHQPAQALLLQQACRKMWGIYLWWMQR